MTGRSLLAIVLAATFAACGADDGQPRWTDSDELGSLPVLDPVTVADGNGWRIEVGDEPRQTGELPRLCLQAVVAEQPLGCIVVDAQNGNDYGYGAIVRVGNERVIWKASTITDTETSVDYFVVWSTTAPHGRRLEPITYRDVNSLLWIMEPGEAPWGYQAIAADGTLIEQWAHVGLPAN